MLNIMGRLEQRISERTYDANICKQTQISGHVKHRLPTVALHLPSHLWPIQENEDCLHETPTVETGHRLQGSLSGKTSNLAFLGQMGGDPDIQVPLISI